MEYLRSLSSFFFRKKRTAEESNDDEQKNEGSDAENDAKRAKLVSLNRTTLQDLPTEMIQLILVKAVAMEVKSMKLVKSVWKEKAELVISRLRTVCSHWNSTLTTNFFLSELHRTLDETAQETILLEVLHQSEIPLHAHKLTTMKDEIFIIEHGHRIIVYNRNNFADMKDIIELSGHTPLDIAVCNVSNCVYVLVNAADYAYSIFRITKNEWHQFGQFKSSPWITDIHMRVYPCISVSANGTVIVRSYPLMICAYKANGHFQQHVGLSTRSIPCIGCWCNPIQKSNGNFLLACDKVHGYKGANAINETEAEEELDEIESTGSDDSETTDSDDDYTTEFHVKELVEFDATGSVLQTCKSSPSIRRSFGLGGVQMGDSAGRFVIAGTDNRIRLFDAEFNRLQFTGPRLIGGKLHYSSERNEVVSVESNGHNSSLLTIFRFKEE